MVKPSDAGRRCPKCGLVNLEPQLYFRMKITDRGMYDIAIRGGCSCKDACPDGEHVHWHCAKCRYWEPRACADADGGES